MIIVPVHAKIINIATHDMRFVGRHSMFLVVVSTPSMGQVVAYVLTAHHCTTSILLDTHVA
jgi:hypothetical protein